VFELGDNYLLFWLIVSAVGFAIWGLVNAARKSKEKNVIINDIVPDIEKYATVVDKTAGIEQTGTVRNPNHETKFLVKFQYDNGEEIVLDVPQEIYDQFIVGMRDTLVTQNNKFLSFGILAAEEIKITPFTG
jgi:hypothetical protein